MSKKVVAPYGKLSPLFNLSWSKSSTRDNFIWPLWTEATYLPPWLKGHRASLWMSWNVMLFLVAMFRTLHGSCGGFWSSSQLFCFMNVCTLYTMYNHIQIILQIFAYIMYLMMQYYYECFGILGLWYLWKRFLESRSGEFPSSRDSKLQTHQHRLDAIFNLQWWNPYLAIYIAILYRMVQKWRHRQSA